MRESHRRIQERFPRRSLELPPLFGHRPPPAAACLRLQFGQSVSSSATAASVALDTNRNSARPALQNRRSHSSNCALHPGSSRHGLALASPVRQTRAGPQYQLAASCVANPLVSHVKGGACSKDCLPPSPCSTSSSLRSFNASRNDSKAKKPKIPTAERQNFNCRELSRLGYSSWETRSGRKRTSSDGQSQSTALQVAVYLPDYRAAFACSHFRYPHRHRCHLAMDFPLARSATGLPCSAEMTRSVRSALYAGSVVYP